MIALQLLAARWRFALRTYVDNEREDTRVPFLRGILTRSLLDAGMAFEDAFQLATKVRKDLADVATISIEDLRDRVTGRLEKLGDEAVLHAYRQPHAGPTRILVSSRNGSSSAFSRGRLERFLQASGLRTSDAEEVTAKIFDRLLVHGTEVISTSRLGLLTYLCLRHEVGKKAARRFLLWLEFQRSERPLMLMIGGAVGAGKSSLATEVAHRLEIVRIQSTDMLREVMRTMIPQRLLPVLHVSSFEAWETLPFRDRANRDRDLLVAEGFRSQAQLLEVPCKAVLHRAERESVSVILEGVHALPNLLQEQTDGTMDAIRVHVTLAVLQSSVLKSRLRGRGAQTPKRHAQKYLHHFDSIWSLQSFLLSEADRHETAIVTNDDLEKAAHQVIVTINRELSAHFNGTPEGVFGDWLKEAHIDLDDEHWDRWVPALSKP
jgi:2-phosphoglycerate kinase